MIDDDVLFTKEYADAADGDIITEWSDGSYECKGYSKCPNCGGEVGSASDLPEPGMEMEDCIGYPKNRGPDYDDAFAEENGCGWSAVTADYTNSGIDLDV